MKNYFLEYSNNHSDEIRDKIIVSNTGLCHYVANKYISDKFDVEELSSIAMIGLIKAVDSFDVHKGITFSTYAIKCMTNQIFMAMRKRKREGETISIDEPTGENITVGDMLVSDEVSPEESVNDDYLIKLVNSLPPREKKIMHYFYGFGCERKKQAEIARIMNLSQSYVSRIVKNGTNKIAEIYKYSLGDDTGIKKRELDIVIPGIPLIETLSLYKKLTRREQRILMKGFEGDLSTQLSYKDKKEIDEVISKMHKLYELYLMTIAQYFQCDEKEVPLFLNYARENETLLLKRAFGEDYKENNISLLNKEEVSYLLELAKIIQRRKSAKRTVKEFKTLQDIVNADIEDINSALKTMSEPERKMIYKRYGTDLQECHPERLNTEEKGILNRIYIPKLKKRLERKKNAKSVYEVLNCTKEEYDIISKELTEEERKALVAKFGEDNDNPQNNYICKEQSKEYNKVIGLLTRLLTKYRKGKLLNRKKEKVPKLGLKETVSSNYLQVLSSINCSTVIEYMMQYCSAQEMLIVSLKLGFVDGKQYTNEEIADRLDIKAYEVPQVVHLFLKKYRTKYMEIVDEAIDEYESKNAMRVLERKGDNYGN